MRNGKESWTNQIAGDARQFDLYDTSSTVTEASAPCTNCATKTTDFSDNLSEVERMGNLTSSDIDKDIPSICFHAAALIAVDEPGSRLYGCKSKNSEWPDRRYRMRPCLNEQYADMTAKAFNKVADCFGFSLNEKRAAFALFNHESHFILNARSPKKARCYGQMIMRAIKYVNQNIYYRNHGFKYGDVYKNAVNNCPGLKDKVIPPGIVTETAFSNARLKEKMRRASITCGLTQDPYACLFYSMFNVKMNLKEFNDNYNEIPDYIGSSQDVSGKTEDDFKLPIMLNEVVIVKGRVRNKKTGKIENIDRVFWDSSQISKEFQNKEYNTSQLEIRKVSLFKPDTLKNVFLHYSHNGGRSYSGYSFKGFCRRCKKKNGGNKSLQKRETL